MKERQKLIVEIIIGIIGSVAALIGVSAFNQYVLMSLPLFLRMVLSIVTYLTIAVVPFCIVIINKDGGCK